MQRYVERIRVVAVHALVVKINFFSPSVLLYLWYFLPYRLRSHHYNKLNFLKTLACTVALCFFATIHQRQDSSFVYYRNFVVFSTSNVT